MGRKKMTEKASPSEFAQADASTSPPAEDSPQPRQKTQTQMVEDCLNAKGWDYKPKKIQEWLLQSYNADLKTSQISTIKSTLMRRREESGRGGSSGGGGETVAAPRGGENLSVEELRTIKQLATRVGPARFRDLVELLCS